MMFKEDFLKNYTELISSGSTPKGGNKVYLKKGEILFFRGQNILMNRFSDHDSVYISNEIHNRMKRTWVKKGDVLIVITGSIGRTAVYEGEDYKANVNQHVCIIRLKDFNVVNPYYLSYFLANPTMQRHIKRISIGATRPALNFSQIGKFKIPIPSIKIQMKIVEMLEKTEKLQEWRVKTNKLVDEYLDSGFHSIFGDPIKNEENWEVKKLSDVADVVSGVTKGRKLQNKETVFAPYLRVANVQDGYLDLDEIKQIEVLTTDVEKYKLFEGDIVLTEGGDPDKLGRGAVWHNEVPNCIHQNHIFRVRLKNGDLNPTYLSKLIGSLYGKLYFLKSAKQTTGIASINSTQLKKFPVIIPPIELQNQFAEIVQQVETLKSHQSQSKQQIDNLFNTLMQKAFKGELTC
ncbi:MAG: restriction endonuclease subunit S [Methanobacterium sp.]